jgi:hypothetical protein
MITFKIRFLGEDSEVTWNDKRKQIVRSDNPALLDFIMQQRSLFDDDGFDYNNGPPIPADKIQTNLDAFSNYLRYIQRRENDSDFFEVIERSEFPTVKIPEDDIRKLY